MSQYLQVSLIGLKPFIRSRRPRLAAPFERANGGWRRLNMMPINPGMAELLLSILLVDHFTPAYPTQNLINQDAFRDSHSSPLRTITTHYSTGFPLHPSTALKSLPLSRRSLFQPAIQYEDEIFCISILDILWYVFQNSLNLTTRADIMPAAGFGLPFGIAGTFRTIMLSLNAY